MARRIRTIKPEFFTSEDIAKLPYEVRLTFIGLWVYVDHFGAGNANPSLIKATIWPLDDGVTKDDILTHLLQLEALEMVELYDVEGREYLSVVNWDRHQKLSHPGDRLTPLSPREMAAGMIPEPFLGEGKGRGEESEGESEGDRESGRDAGNRLREGASGTVQELPPSAFCKNHQPAGTDEPCRACGNARMRHQSWLASQLITRQNDKNEIGN